MAKQKTQTDPATVVGSLLKQVEDLEAANEELSKVIVKMTAERRDSLGEQPDDAADSQQKAYELMAHLIEKLTDQRNAAYRKINACIKQLIK